MFGSFERYNNNEIKYLKERGKTEMKTPFNNKAITTTAQKKEDSDSMNKDIKKVMDAAAEITTEYPENRAHILKGIADAQEAQKEAITAKETAETETDFNKACDDEMHARDKEAFYKRQLDKMDFTPRMSEEEYYKHVETIEMTVEKAAADFRAYAEKMINDLTKARETYLSTLTDADTALSELDRAANVLQSKYRYKECAFVNAPSHYVEDRNEWKRHAVRYIKSGKGYDLITKDGNAWNIKMCAAWKATEAARGGY